jgi:alkanesulfonate monooxygenase SsuD/methylene tetrahydromethanopterin reductase-like flavin-dependent oxidoreductase (luciferase family)
MRFGVYLPTFAWPDLAFDQAARVRTFAQLQQSYFLGTTREIVERIRDLEAAGIQDVVLGTCDDDLAQLERCASEIVARFKAEPARGVPT